MKMTKKRVMARVSASPAGRRVPPRRFRSRRIAADQQRQQQDVEQRETQVAEADLAHLGRVDVEPEGEEQPHRQVLGDEAFVAVGADARPRGI